MPQTSTTPRNIVTRQITKNLKYDFTDEQLKEMSDTVFTNIDLVGTLRAEKKETTRKFSDKIKGLEETNSEYAHLIQTGHEYRDIACDVKYNFPSDGKKTIVRNDTYESWVEDMAPNEYNLENLPLPDFGEEE